MYSASAVDSATTGCLRLAQDTVDPHTFVTYPVVDLRPCRSPAQSASTNDGVSDTAAGALVRVHDPKLRPAPVCPRGSGAAASLQSSLTVWGCSQRVRACPLHARCLD